MGTLVRCSKFGTSVFGLVLLLFLGLVNGLATENSKNVTLVVVGRSRSGISATVRELVGPNRILIPPTGTLTSIQEHLIPIPGQDRSFLKVAEVEGLVDGNSLEKDVSIISSLKSYLTDPSGLNSSPPNFFLIASNFDDDRIIGNNSVLVETINLISKLQESLYNSTSQENTIFLLTKFSSTTRATQRRPAQRLQEFVETIRNRTNFSSPSTTALLGENDWLGYGLQVENGYPKLPNGDKYPENVFNKMELISREANDSNAAMTIKIFKDMRNTAVYSNYYVVGEQPPVLKTTETGYSNLPPLPTTMMTITTTPSKTYKWWEKTTTWLKTTIIRGNDSEGNTDTVHVTTDTSSITEPMTSELLEGLDYRAETLGQGYHMLKELVLSAGPFQIGSYETGFQSIDPPCKVVKAAAFDSLALYVENRLRSSFNFSHALPPNPERYFRGRIMPGNLIRGVNERAYRPHVEVRTDKEVMRLKMNFDLDPGFLNHFNSLPFFDYSSPVPDCGGKRRWKTFFDKYGTQVVVCYMVLKSNRSIFPIRMDFDRFIYEL